MRNVAHTFAMHLWNSDCVILKKGEGKKLVKFLAVFCLYVYMGCSKILGMTTLKHENFALTSIGPGKPCREVQSTCFSSLSIEGKTPNSSMFSRPKNVPCTKSHILISTFAVGQQENNCFSLFHMTRCS